MDGLSHDGFDISLGDSFLRNVYSVYVGFDLRFIDWPDYIYPTIFFPRLDLPLEIPRQSPIYNYSREPIQRGLYLKLQLFEERN